MPTAPRSSTPRRASHTVRHARALVRDTITTLESLASPKVREEMGTRYGIHTDHAFGLKMAAMQGVARKLGTNHALALALWATGWYEARMVACLVDDPTLVTSPQMDRWCRDFDNWGICDTACFKLFDRAPHALAKVRKWSGRPEEFVKRAAFALLASIALHDKTAPDTAFLDCLPLIERAAVDDRHFVKKGVSWALRAIAHRNPALKAATRPSLEKLLASPHASARWIARDARK